MPQYRFGCEGCEVDTLVWCVREDRHLPRKCAKCGKAMKQLAPSRINVNCDRLDYVTSDITGEPVRIATRRQLDDLCARNGVRRVTSDEVGVNRPKTESEIRKLAGVGDFKSECEQMAQAMGEPLLIRRKKGTKPKRMSIRESGAAVHGFGVPV